MRFEVDHKRLLLWYIDHVGNCEGTDFLSYIEEDDYEGLSLEERTELARLRDIARNIPFDKIPEGS